MTSEKCLFRWAIGSQDTLTLSSATKERMVDMISLARLSILSFQCRFPDAVFVLLYNGLEFDLFCEMFHKSLPVLKKKVEIIDQSIFKNPYSFYPHGVWWKWVPFRLDVNMTEISVDTDIICIGNPADWFNWIKQDSPILVAPERFSIVTNGTCGEFYRHPVLLGKKPLNCGVVGQRQGYDFGERFFEVTRSVHMGETKNSLFITEQGAINVWARSLELEGVDCYCLDFMCNAWIRDFLYFIQRGVDIQTVHAVTWHKKIVKSFQDLFERKILDDNYSQAQFLTDILKRTPQLDEISKTVISRQIGPNADLREFLLV